MEDRKIPERPEPNTTEYWTVGSGGGGLVWAVVGLVLAVVGLARMVWPLVEPLLVGCR